MISTTESLSRLGIRQLSYIGAYACFAVIVMASILLHRKHGEFITFGTYWASGRAAINDLNPYAAYPETLRSDYSRFGGPKSLPDLNLNPPCILPYIQVLSHLSIERFTIVWMLTTALFFSAGVALLIRNLPEIQGRQVFWLLLSVPAIGTLMNGQIYGLLFLLSTLAWLFNLRRKDTASAIAIALLVAIRPAMVLWPVMLYLAGHRRLALRSFGAIPIIYAVPLLIYGPSIYREWLSAVAQEQHWVDPKNIALIPLFSRFGFRLVGIFASVVTGALLAWWAHKKKPDFTSASGIGICAGILCPPLGWFDYTLFLAPLFVTRPWRLLPTIAAGLLMLPVPLSVRARGIPYFVAILIISNHLMLVGRPRLWAGYRPALQDRG